MMRLATRFLLVAALIAPAVSHQRVLADGAAAKSDDKPYVAPEEALSRIERGDYAGAEEILRKQLDDPTAPATTDPAIQLQIIERTRADFRLSEADILQQLRESIPDVTQADVDKWRTAGVLQGRRIDGEQRYFRNAAANLFRLSEEARKRRPVTPEPAKRFALDELIVKLNKLAADSLKPEIYPVKHHVNYTLTIKEENPRLKPGAKVRVWLPYPQEYRDQQRDVKLLASSPAGVQIADEKAPQRTIYFEQIVSDDGKVGPFKAEYEFTTSAYVPKLDPTLVKPYDVDGEIYQKFTAERMPHIVLAPYVKALAQEIVGDETNPLEKSRLIFRWVSKNIPWVSEMEYSTIPSLSQKGLAARCGDCGVQNTTFVTLCRAVGVPARWQSGFGTKPTEEGMHDWAEIYIEPWGWLPADASYGVRQSDDPAVRDFFCGHMDPYRLIVNLDYGRELQPPKTSFRSEPIDFQRGEVEVDGHNLYYNDWDWDFDVTSTPPETP